MLKPNQLSRALRHEELLDRLRDKALYQQSRPILERCPYCKGPIAGWSVRDIWYGWRMEGETKHYHCREAAVED